LGKTREEGRSKHVAVLTIYKALLIYIHIYIYICCTFVGVDKKLYKMRGTYIKISVSVLCVTSDNFHPSICNVFSRNELPAPTGVMKHLNFEGVSFKNL